MSNIQDELTKWLLERGYGEEQRGYGHATAEEISEALISARWITEDDGEDYL